MNSTSASLLLRVRRVEDREAWDRLVELYTPLLYFWRGGLIRRRLTRPIWCRRFSRS